MKIIAKQCSIKGCNNTTQYTARGWCNKHYQVWKRHGDPLYPTKHWERHGLSKTRPVEYKAWTHLKGRCYAKNDMGYPHYGGRGIRVCSRWRNSFPAFYYDMGPKPEGMSVDRVNNDGNYSCGKCEECLANGWPMNCRWATRKQQAINISMKSNNTTGYRGVFHKKGSNLWVAVIRSEGIAHRLGSFSSPRLAAEAYNKGALRYHGKDAKLNDLAA